MNFKLFQFFNKNEKIETKIIILNNSININIPPCLIKPII
jgi:hypothetical protein